jgi:peptidoglycan/xylan/chitin deacetylase (PgdA/CDA1 family)
MSALVRAVLNIFRSLAYLLRGLTRITYLAARGVIFAAIASALASYSVLRILGVEAARLFRCYAYVVSKHARYFARQLAGASASGGRRAGHVITRHSRALAGALASVARATFEIASKALGRGAYVITRLSRALAGLLATAALAALKGASSALGNASRALGSASRTLQRAAPKLKRLPRKIVLELERLAGVLVVDLLEGRWRRVASTVAISAASVSIVYVAITTDELNFNHYKETPREEARTVLTPRIAIEPAAPEGPAPDASPEPSREDPPEPPREASLKPTDNGKPPSPGVIEPALEPAPVKVSKRTPPQESKKSKRPERPRIADITRGGHDSMELSVTFDGGSEAEDAGPILDALFERGIKTTFFLTGSFIREFPLIVERIVAEGHEVGNHTMTHPHLTSYESDRRHRTLAGITRTLVTEELRRTEEAYFELTGRKMAPLWRAPYGEINSTIRQWAFESGYLHIGWTSDHTRRQSLDTLDWVYDKDSKLYLTGLEIKDKILNFGQGANGLKGGIILMHLGTQRKEDRAAALLGEMLDDLARKGYRFVKVSTLIKGNETARDLLDAKESLAMRAGMNADGY